jgi:hypothetical protein
MLRPLLRRSAVVLFALLLTVAALGTATSVGASGCAPGNYTCYRSQGGYAYAYPYGYAYPYAYAPYVAAPRYVASYVAPSYVYPNYIAPYAGGRYYYRDNRFCGDGQIFVQGGQYFCASTGLPVYASGGSWIYR